MDTYTVKQLLNSIIDENISIRLDRYDKIVVRTKFSASHGGNVSQHGTSIKVDISNMEYQIEIPTKSYLGLSKSDRAMRSINAFKKNKVLSQSKVRFIESFIYVNQAAILAYWYIPNDKRYTDAIEKYIKQSDTDYSKISASPKTDAELESDKRVITEFVRKELNDQTIELDFGK